MNQIHRAGLALIALAVILGACSRSERPPAKVLPGALTKSIDSYTGDEFYDFVTKLSYTGGHERERDCKGDSACDSGAKKIKVMIDAVATQDSISAATVPQFGVIYGRAINKGDAEEARYHMKPGSHLEFYVLITGDSTTGMRWRLEQLNKTQGQRSHTQIASGKFIGCSHPWTPGARADFKTCAETAVRRDSLMKLGLLLQGGGSPIWFACTSGCCVDGGI
ncbi:MAG TPA: hypothetical protein VF929_02545 [Gemmatimonadaceae bacterium]